MTLYLRHFSRRITFPAATEPAWSSQVERWYQVDRAGYLVAELCHSLQPHLRDRPDLLLLASPGGSSATDFEFAQQLKTTGLPSPSKFVHTLPNIRSTLLSQVLRWSGPMLCIQNESKDLLTALREASFLLNSPASSELTKIWVISIDPTPTLGSETARLLQLQNSPFESIENEPGSLAFSGKSDVDLLGWLESVKGNVNEFQLGN